MGNIMREYPFKRNFYYETEKAIEKSAVSFVLGARKCGKSICMKQLESSIKEAVYVDVKKDFENDIEKIKFMKQVRNDIENNKKIVYLIDEATYLHFPDKEIAETAGAFSDVKNTNTKIVFAGSQSKALDCWGHRAFAGNASFITADFLSYPEWLAYKGITEVSARTYQDFITGTREFYSEFTSTKDYLQGCLDEKVLSNQKAVEIIFENDCSDISAEMLLDVLYASLITLHNHTNYQSFASSHVLKDTITHIFSDEYLQIGDEELQKRIDGIIGERYRNFRNMDARQIKQCLQFLTNCGLITTTYVTDDFSANPYVCQRLLSDHNDDLTKPDVMRKINICISYPMFYADIVKDLLGDYMPDQFPGALLGSIVECHTRGLLPQTGCFEYHDSEEREIDYVSNSRLTAIEISTANKKIADTHFEILPEDYKKILLTKDKTGRQDDTELVPYYQFIYDLSVGKNLF